MKKLKGHLDHMDMINEEAALRCFQSPNKNIHGVIKKQFCQLVLKYRKEILQIR